MPVVFAISGADMTNNTDCHHIQIAQNEFGHVQVCSGCGQVRINIQFATLRLEPEAFESFYLMIAEAQKQLTLLTMNAQYHCGDTLPNSHSH
jgi:hypothetical protein